MMRSSSLILCRRLPQNLLEQAKKFTSMALKEDPDEGSILLGMAKKVQAPVLPGHRI
jgi:hypothetical protein